MRCEECLMLMEEYLDGELAARDASRVAAHVGSCAECAACYEGLKAEQSIYASYKREVDVTPAMWEAVLSRIVSEEQPAPAMAEAQAPGALARLRLWVAAAFSAPRLSPAFAAALVIAAVGLTVAVMTFTRDADRGQQVAAGQNPGEQKEREDRQGELAHGPQKTNPPESADDSPAPQGESQEQPEAAPRAGGRDSLVAKENRPRVAQPSNRDAVSRQPTPEQLVREAEQKYLAAIAIVERDVNRRRASLDPALLVRLDNALASIDLTIEETRRAVRQHPGDPVALQYLLAAYSKKIDALREMARE